MAAFKGMHVSPAKHNDENDVKMTSRKCDYRTDTQADRQTHIGRLALGYCFTPYQRLRLYNGAPFSRLLRHAGDTENVFSA